MTTPTMFRSQIRKQHVCTTHAKRHIATTFGQIIMNSFLTGDDYSRHALTPHVVMNQLVTMTKFKG